MQEHIAPPPADLLTVQGAATLSYRLIRVLALPLLHLLFQIRVRGREHFPKKGTYVLIANHLNWLDSFAILATCPVEPRVHFLGDTTILVTRKLQWWIVRKVGGFVPVDRRHPARGASRTLPSTTGCPSSRWLSPAPRTCGSESPCG